MAAIQRQFVNTEYGQMHLRVAQTERNEHPPLICLHMTPLSGRSFTQFMASACRDRCVIAPDYHGYGESDRPSSSPHVTVQDYARTIWQALDELGIQKVDLLGHHTGSKVAVEMAHQQPGRVHGLVMVAASLLTDEELSKASGDYDPVPLDQSGERYVKGWQGILAARGPGMSLEQAAVFFAESLRAGDASLWAYRAAFEYNRCFSKVLSELPHHVVVINPKDDLTRYTPRVMDYLRSGKIIHKPEWGHGFFDVFTEDAVSTICEALIESKS